MNQINLIKIMIVKYFLKLFKMSYIQKIINFFLFNY